MYKFALNAALKKIAVARDWFELKHAKDFDIDWAMLRFETAMTILKQLRRKERRMSWKLAFIICSLMLSTSAHETIEWRSVG